ncbi:MAG: radical SAM protein, partial [Spirochaetales bacterium]|nr:radical SAM protein [Spirochaetales bacterium]
LPARYVIKKVVQATRGCYYSCSFCSVPKINPGYRMRPVKNVLADCGYDNFRFWWQRKIVWFWDDNLTANKQYIKKLLSGLIPLKKWWLTQASIDVAFDDELLDLMKKSGCIGVFIGIESFLPGSLDDANKHQNKFGYYKKAVAALHAKGICVMAGFIAGFDSDTPETIRGMADQLMDIGIDVPFISILTPFQGTSLYEKLKTEGRLLSGRSLGFSNGYNVAFYPACMTPDELLSAHRSLWTKAFSLFRTLQRIFRSLRYLRFGAFCMSLTMNGFYCLKNVTGNTPIDMGAVHPEGRKKLVSPSALKIKVRGEGMAG